MRLFVPVIFVCACILTSCAGRLEALEGPGGSDGKTPIFTDCGFAILTQTCPEGSSFSKCKSCSGFGSCHGKDTPSIVGLDLTADGIGDGIKYINKGADNTSMVGGCGTAAMPPVSGKVYIDPKNAENSLIYQKVTTTFGGCGSRMPFASTVFLSTTEQLCILDWIKSVPGVRQGAAGDAGGSQ
jgi:hypothetical protein